MILEYPIDDLFYAVLLTTIGAADDQNEAIIPAIHSPTVQPQRMDPALDGRPHYETMVYKSPPSPPVQPRHHQVQPFVTVGKVQNTIRLVSSLGDMCAVVLDNYAEVENGLKTADAAELLLDIASVDFRVVNACVGARPPPDSCNGIRQVQEFQEDLKTRVNDMLRRYSRASMPYRKIRNLRNALREMESVVLHTCHEVS